MTILRWPRFKIQQHHEIRGILFLWAYDMVKYWLFRDLMISQGIDPLIFLFFDMVTVAPFIIGSARLVNALTGQALAWPEVLGWGGIVVVNTVLPYVYAALAGQRQFSASAWVIFWVLMLVVLLNLARTIRVQVIRARASDTQGHPD